VLDLLVKQVIVVWTTMAMEGTILEQTEVRTMHFPRALDRLCYGARVEITMCKRRIAALAFALNKGLSC